MKFSETRGEGKYVKAEDLQGRRVTVVIESYQKELLGQGADAKEKLILYFQGKTKGMVCNVTNGGKLADMFGDEMDDWIGREIVLGVERVPFQGKMVPGLRISQAPKRAPAPQQNGGREHVFEERKGYTLSTTRRPDPIEEVTGAPTRDPDDNEIPF